ncbi:sulfite exporter TauE/SafE family protein [Jonesiaceae bacterium BS-20]|uniref:Probable membrane transporter protein n=1 Tax=Jonesiaceae bacterium BS-20 TaxID=3120821 RepID=A0AAU7DRD7_9MICO
MLTLLLMLVGLTAGIGITTVGPGGVLTTVGLVHLTTLSPAVIAGTVMTTNIANGLVGTTVYARSGHLKDHATRRLAKVLTGTAVLGTPAGVFLNTGLSNREFELILAVFLLAVAGLVWLRQRRAGVTTDGPQLRLGPLGVIGILVACASGLLGVGGPVLTVPILIALGVRVLPALAAAQVQSIVISTVGATGYLLAGAVDWTMVAVIGMPQLVGVVLGWKIARAVPSKVLTSGLIIVLVLLVPTLLFL